MSGGAPTGDADSGPSPVRAVRLARLALVLSVAAAFGLAYLLSVSFRAQVNLAVSLLSRGDVDGIRDYVLSFGLWAPVVSSLLMVLQALAAPLPSFFITFANGLAFGVFWGWLLSVFGHALAATICFWISRSLGRVPVETLVGKAGLESADRWFARWGAYAVVVARLVPGISFDIISYAAGLTRMGFRRFLTATLIGTLPQTFFYSYLGRQAPRYFWALLLISGLFVTGVALVAFLRRGKLRKTRSNGAGQRNP